MPIIAIANVIDRDCGILRRCEIMNTTRATASAMTTRNYDCTGMSAIRPVLRRFPCKRNPAIYPTIVMDIPVFLSTTPPVIIAPEHAERLFPQTSATRRNSRG